MDRQIIRQGYELALIDRDDPYLGSKKIGPFIYYDDGTKELMSDYRARLNIQKKDHTKKYPAEEQAERDQIITEVLKYDMSAGMHYDPEKGFLRDENGKYKFVEKTARETLGNFTTRELRQIKKQMKAIQEGKNHE